MSLTATASTAIGNLFSETPFHIILYITSVCNARCEYCYYAEELNKNIKYELTDDEIVRVFEGVRKIPHLSISGGEPFLRKNIDKILNRITRVSQPRVVSIPTNCSTPERIWSTFDQLCRQYPDTLFDLHISLDGLGKVHDELRKIDGLFEKVMETNVGARELLEKHANFGVKIVSVFSSFNQDRFEELLDHIEKEMAFNRLIVAWPHGTCSEQTKRGLSRQRFEGFVRRAEGMNRKRMSQNTETQVAMSVKNTKEHYMRAKWNAEKNLGDYCNAGKKIVVIGETGKVFPCESFWYEMGNLRDFNYDLPRLLREMYPAFHDKHIKPGCHCEWGCAQNVAIVTNPGLWPMVLKDWISNRVLDN